MSALRCRHCGFLPWLPREVMDEQCARCGYLRRPPAINGWQAFGNPAEVIPIEDLRVHRWGLKCWCAPTLDDGVIVHQAMDKREEYERGRKSS